ncbi:HAD family hydrolase [Thiohalocapsa marina]|uniref:HAD family hydrolase n=1 Tax=Thiohalocapsa marina TaxID=424902 RepID=A0A5M8FFZ9_9GAMM|nr:HAD family hydrolase [Thiohalocapsa marina]KAA6183637.1 HAD family hydrolase [Thiohalocapsa marina]
MRLKLITVDLDDTLWPCAPVIRGAEHALHAWLADRAPRLAEAHDTDSLRAHRMALMRDRPEIAHDLTAVRLHAMRALMEQFGYAPTLADQAVALFQQHRNRVQPYADVAPALTRLGVHCRLVAVTNGNAEVHATPLSAVFHHALTAAEAGAAKPDPALFQLAMRRVGVGPAETLHVGDDPVRDVEAARRVGIGAVWVNRDGRPWPEELPPPLLQVTELGAMVDWLVQQGWCGEDHAV